MAGSNDRKARNRKRAKQQKQEQKKQHDEAAKLAAEKADAEARAAYLAEMEAAKTWLENLSPQDIFNQSLFEEKAIEQARIAFRSAQPFPHLHWKNFMDAAFVSKVKEELAQGDNYLLKRNDLYHFYQTDDLASHTSPLVSKMRATLYSKVFRDLLSAVTGIPLHETAPATFAAVYQQGHHLLAHDDELEGRRIAYIVYLVPEGWEEADGGNLDLYGMCEDGSGQPGAVQKRLVPDWNSFACFEVSPVSFHAVSEVLTAKKKRASISGWFHGPPIERPVLAPQPEVPVVPIDHDTTDPANDIEHWVARNYRKPQMTKQVRNRFEEESSIELHSFIKADRYAEIVKALQEEAKWREIGPPNKRLHMVMDEVTTVTASPIIKQFYSFLRSKQFVYFLQGITNLSITHGHCQGREFRPGHYTLAHDDDPEMMHAGLDVVMSCMPPQTNWRDTWGGAVYYVDKGDEEPLIDIPPHDNTLSIVFRASPGTYRFVKYVTHSAEVPRTDFSCVFRTVEQESESDIEEEEEEDEEDEKEE